MVLAGGLSERMGRPKALLGLGTSNFLGTILARLEPLQLPFTAVVTNPRVPLALAGPRILINREPRRGQLSSLRLALEAGARDFPWLLVALVDQPAVSAATYRALVDVTAEPAAMWVPSFEGRRGHPLVFDRCCYDDLLAAPDDEGMRWVVARHRERRREVPVDDPEIHRDVDTPEDYEALLARIR